MEGKAEQRLLTISCHFLHFLVHCFRHWLGFAFISTAFFPHEVWGWSYRVPRCGTFRHQTGRRPSDFWPKPKLNRANKSHSERDSKVLSKKERGWRWQRFAPQESRVAICIDIICISSATSCRVATMLQLVARNSLLHPSCEVRVPHNFALPRPSIMQRD